jgi:1,4-dihydroxy-2-naphthoyl-CoA synthase
VRSVFGEVPVQRCLWHKERNVMRHLAERDRPPIKARLRRAWRDTDYHRALEQLTGLADELVNHDDIRTAAVSLAADIAQQAPLAVQSVRATLRYELISAVEVVLQREAQEQRRLWGTEDAAIGIRAARLRQPPEFVGR